MVVQRAQGLFRILFLGQLVLASSTFWLWAYLTVFTRADFSDELFSNYVTYCAIIWLGLTIEVSMRKNKIHHMVTPHLVEKERLSRRQTFFVGIVLLLFVVATKDKSISRVFLFSYLPILYLTLICTHYFVPLPLSRIIFGGLRTENAILVGSGFRLPSIIRWLKEKKSLGIKCLGWLGNEDKLQFIEGIPLLGTPDDLEQVIQKMNINMVLLMGTSSYEDRLPSLPAMCEKHGARLLIVSDLADKLRHPLVYFDDGGHHFIGLREEPLENPWNRLCKRFFDFFFSFFVTVTVLPWMCAIVWLLHRWQSPGPLFFIQTRAGLQNYQFPMIKFRTMHIVDAEEPFSASKSRLFPAGAILRRFSLDELPQFWNVLRGDMSVVGPRPHHIEDNEEFAQVLHSYHVRNFVKPGVTGLAQVRGFRGLARKREDVISRVETDIFYIENWSFTLDVMIISKTVWQMVRPPKTAF